MHFSGKNNHIVIALKLPWPLSTSIKYIVKDIGVIIIVIVFLVLNPILTGLTSTILFSVVSFPIIRCIWLRVVSFRANVSH